MIRRVWIGYGIIAVGLTIARIIVPEGSLGAGSVTYIYPALTITAVALGVRFNRPARTLPWILLLIMSAAGGAGNVIMSAYLTRGAVPFPSAADALWLLCYPLLLIGLMRLVDGLSWRRDRAGILDTLMVTAGLGLGIWLLFLRDLISPDMPVEARLVTIAYPLADLLLIAGVIRMFTSSARRGPAFWQLVASLRSPRSGAQ
ncbi:hypothetical protein M1L60_45840 [Actinoplanes sp. TRM 88003]|uniref:Uncharacterized protein n=1 Tax=Paractinoplanes aksuensis TaxID=2939490 RepID=A0ABT1E468_9ACTN|nr:hypothetical protein [Actinoplanes aksuensis]MCO8277919.1 hypothetical protein [Actinoplanes aksuensis]